MVDDGTVRAVDRAVSILIAMADRRDGIGVTELARTLGLHKSTASRLLATLQRRGLVCQDRDSSRYRLGPAMVRLGCNAEKALDLGPLAADEVGRLARLLGENVALEVPVGDTLIRVAYADASGRGRLYGTRNLPIHATAGGKLLLAHHPERDVVRLFKAGLTVYTATTIVALAPILQELMLIRKRGYATAFGELDPRINSIAVPVFDQRSTVAAALEVHGPSLRVTASRLPEILAHAEVSTARIMSRIGGVVRCTCEACSSRSSNTVVDWARHVALSRERPLDEEGEGHAGAEVPATAAEIASPGPAPASASGSAPARDLQPVAH